MKAIYRIESCPVGTKYCCAGARGPWTGKLINAEPALPIMRKRRVSSVEFILNEDRGGLEVGDLVGYAAGPLVLKSACATAIIKGCQVGDHELVPAHLLNKRGGVHDGSLNVLNPLHLVDAVDPQRSQVLGSPVFIVNPMVPYALKRTSIPTNRDVFRVKGLAACMCTQRFVDFVEQHNFTNFNFNSVDLS